MTGREIIKLMRLQEGGDKFATFFFVCLLGVAIACFAAGGALQYRDTLVRFVPATAIAYVHANGSEAARLAAYGGYRGPTPREAALYALATEDGHLRWSTLVASEQHESLSSTPWQGSLADDRRSMHALTAARSAFSMQGYFMPSAVLPTEMGASLGSGEPMIFGASRRDGGMVATLLPTGSALRPSSVDTRSGTMAPVTPELSSSSAAFSGSDLPLDSFELIFRDSYAATEMTSEALSAEIELRKLLSSGAITVLAGEPSLMSFSNLSTDDLRASIENFARLAWPKRADLKLPDGGAATELTTSPDRQFRQDTAEDWILELPNHGPKITLSSHDQKTVLVASRSAVAFDDQYLLINRANCLGNGAVEQFIISPQLKLNEFLPPIEHIFAYFGQITLVINRVGDNILNICGYTAENVDKSSG
jgi:hypothetical protein